MKVVRFGVGTHEVAIVPQWIAAVRKGYRGMVATVEVRPVMGDWIVVAECYFRTSPSTPADDPGYVAQQRIYEEVVAAVEAAR